MITLTAGTGTGPYIGQLYLQGSAALAATTAISEVGTLGVFVQGDFDVVGGGALPNGRYWVRILKDSQVVVTSDKLFIWKDGKELNIDAIDGGLGSGQGYHQSYYWRK